MGKWIFGCVALLLATPALSQQVATLPPDLRQHNLLAVSPQLFNPVFSLEQPTRHELALWSRWQWQTIDGNPTTLLANYTAKFNRLAAGTGFFQNNIYHFQQTGWMLHLAYEIPISERMRIGLGANFFGYVQELSDNRLILDEPLLPFLDDTRDFVWRLAPAVQFSYDSFGVSLAFENMPDYSFDAQGPATRSGEKTYLLMTHYTFDLGSGAGSEQTLKPILYYKRIPGFDSQVGVTALYSGQSYWVQGGYNSFYGPSLGMGVRFFQRLSLGGLLEFGKSKDPNGLNTTYEVFASYRFGGLDNRKKVVGFEEEVEKEIRQEAERAEAAGIALENARRDSLQTEMALAESRRADSLQTAQRLAEQARLQQLNDSTGLALAEQTRVRDSLERARIAAAEAITLKPGEVYQEVSAEEGLEPGFYLIANVYGTNRYLESFLADLRKKGLEPQYFYRKANKFNYVYLKRYATMSEAREARDSKFGGKYQGDLWIFRVR